MEAFYSLNFLTTNQHISSRITDKLDWFIAQENPLWFAKKLRNSEILFRFRVGNYRAVFRINERGEISIISIIRIKHRREVYE